MAFLLTFLLQLDATSVCESDFTDDVVSHWNNGTLTSGYGNQTENVLACMRNKLDKKCNGAASCGEFLWCTNTSGQCTINSDLWNKLDTGYECSTKTCNAANDTKCLDLCADYQCDFNSTSRRCYHDNPRRRTADAEDSTIAVVLGIAGVVFVALALFVAVRWHKRPEGGKSKACREKKEHQLAREGRTPLE